MSETHLELGILAVSHQAFWELEARVTGPTGRFLLRFNHQSTTCVSQSRGLKAKTNTVHEMSMFFVGGGYVSKHAAFHDAEADGLNS